MSTSPPPPGGHDPFAPPPRQPRRSRRKKQAEPTAGQVPPAQYAQPAAPPPPGQQAPYADSAAPPPPAQHDPHPGQPADAPPPPVDPAAPAGDRLPGEPVAPPPDAGRSDEEGAAAEWRRLHRVTPLLNAWKAGVAVFAIALYQSQEFMADLRERFAAMAILGAVVGLLVLGFVIGLGFGYLAWRRTTYGVSKESVFLHKGVISRQQRHVRLDRVQAVEVTQPLLARLFGFASIKVESAGGAAANLTIAFLTEQDARGLRNELLARAAGAKGGPGADSAATAGAPAAADAQERQIAALSPGRLVGSLALSFTVVFALVALVAIIAASIGTGNAGVFFGAAAPILGAVFYVWGRFAGEFNFRVAISSDGIRLRHGLLETKSRTVPQGRVQAVGISQPLLWRTKDWWRIQVNIAGYGAEETTGTVLYPAATRAEVAFMLSLVLPDLGDERPLPVLHTGMSGIGTDEGFTTSPRRARWVDPLTWRRTAFRITRTAILMRTGRWWRRLHVVPHERTQSIGLTQGPIERKMGLATFVVHSTPGPVVPQVHHLDLTTARDLLVDQAERSRHARREAGLHQGPGAEQEPAPSDTPITLRREYAGVLPSRVAPADPGPGQSSVPTPPRPDQGPTA